MRLLRSFLTLSLSFSILCLSFANSYSEEISWNDYREPVHDIKVTHKERTTVYVDIPDDFIVNKKELSLILTVKSHVYVRSALKSELGFHLFYPSIKVNDHLFGSYRIPVKDLPGEQTHEVKIKTKHLSPGINKLQAIFKWRKEGNWCTGGTCRYRIKEMYFKNAPPFLNTLAISSNPQGAKIYIGGHFHGETPKDVQVGKGWHNIKIEKVGYQRSIEDIKVFEDDEYFVDLEGKIGQRSEEGYGVHWIGEAIHTTDYGEAGVPCIDASINFYIMKGRINGKAVDAEGREYELRGTVSEEGEVSAGMAVGEHTVISFSGKLAEESGMGFWETIRRCSGTWQVRRKLE